jgi:hypothetical protein
LLAEFQVACDIGEVVMSLKVNGLDYSI